MTAADAENSSPERILCIGCGYDLRGLGDDRACPECGIPVARSNLGDRLAGADPAWLRKITLGQTIASYGLAACFWAIALGIIAAAAVVMILHVVASAALPSIVERIGIAAMVIVMAGFYGGLVACAIGAVLLTIMDPRSTLTERILSPRRVARWGMLILLTLVSAMYAARLFWPVAQPAGFRAMQLIIVTTILTVLLCASLRQLGCLLARTSQASLTAEARAVERRLRWLIPVVAVLSLPSVLALDPLGTVRAISNCASIIMVIGLFTSAVHLASIMRRARREFVDCLQQSRSLPAPSPRPSPSRDP